MIKIDEATEKDDVLEEIGELENEEMTQKGREEGHGSGHNAHNFSHLPQDCHPCPVYICIPLVRQYFCINYLSTQLVFWVLFMFDILSDLALEIRTLAELSELSHSGMKIIFTGVSLSFGFSVMLFLSEEIPFDNISRCICLVGENIVLIVISGFLSLSMDLS